MSLCHPSNGSYSCGACCGLFNLDMKPEGIKNLLAQRTSQFKESVDFKVRHTVAEFRQNRERIESELSKKDETTYNCPFLGYVENEKIGCMIHPIYTGDPKSQNFSFYGASICQGYDCKNKERPTARVWEEFFVKLATTSVEYSHLASDHILIGYLELWIQSKGYSLAEGLEILEPEILRILKKRLESLESFYPTSFEILSDPLPDCSSIQTRMEEYLSKR